MKPTPRGLRQLADVATPMAIRVAATLRIVDHLTAGIRNIDDLADRTESNPDALRRLLGHLERAGLLVSNEAGFAPTDLGQQLRDDHPTGLRRWLDIEGGVGRADLCFADLLHTVRTGEPAYRERYKVSFWDDLEVSEHRDSSFDLLMNDHVDQDGIDLKSCFDWSGVEQVIDVGGGSGALLARLLLARDHLHGTLVDRPGTAARAAQRFARMGLSPRAAVSPQSFFDELPRGDVLVISSVLHNWSDKDAIAILRQCRSAMPAEGSVLIVESTGRDGETLDTLMDLRMLAFTGGRERGVADYGRLAEAVGLVVHGVKPATSRPHESVIELRVA